MGPELGLFSCFDTSVLHLEPRGGRAAPPRSCRERVRTGAPTSRHAHRGEQLSQSLAAAGQVGGGRAEVFGVHRGYGSVEEKAFLEWPGQGAGEFLVSKFHRSNLKILLMRSLILHVGLVLVSLL